MYIWSAITSQSILLPTPHLWISPALHNAPFLKQCSLPPSPYINTKKCMCPGRFYFSFVLFLCFVYYYFLNIPSTNSSLTELFRPGHAVFQCLPESSFLVLLGHCGTEAPQVWATVFTKHLQRPSKVKYTSPDHRPPPRSILCTALRSHLW